MIEYVLAFYLTQYQPPEWQCVRWTWTGDVYNRRVYCLEWKKRKEVAKS